MSSEILRILDANCNRAREAMRVIEDYARFALNDAPTCAAIKQLRHEFAAASARFVAEAILHRDTPGDVGTSAKAQTELTRADAGAVVIAAGKRLGEALRSIEEYTKTLDPSMARQIEALRYRFYEIERRLALRIRPQTRFAEVYLYVLITESLCKGNWLEVAEQSIAGGADALQLREKQLEAGELLARARQLVALCHEHGVLCLINDRPDVAMLSGADGVHLGQQDLPVPDARKLLGQQKIIGLSTHNLEQARQAQRDGADYIGVGPLFHSTTKPRDFLPGLDYARQVAREICIPAVAIAGIDASNVDEVISTGLRAVAVSSAVIGSNDPAQAARRIKCRLVPSETGCPTTLSR